ncbi:MAG TPA: hypothetical protein VEP90_09345 [Methylomirabilota bacterium]|nr:MAG: hypothetical protein E6I80_18015 [Chloroflexota bacterium]HYT42539.1 hypothetical protein [Methylomirabilota bacterium]
MSRDETEFINHQKFDEAIEKACSASLRITSDILRFQRYYKQENVNLSRGFNFTLLENLAGRYSLYEIYVGPNDSYRAVVMFLHSRVQGRELAIWIFAFKKQRGIDRPLVERAKAIAREYWNSLERGQR